MNPELQAHGPDPIHSYSSSCPSPEKYIDPLMYPELQAPAPDEVLVLELMPEPMHILILVLVPIPGKIH